MLDVTKAKYVGAYRIWLEFSNGESGEVDLEPDLWGPVFAPLKDPEKFKHFAVSETLHTIAWDNGADFAPEHLYKRVSKHSLQVAGSPEGSTTT